MSHEWINQKPGLELSMCTWMGSAKYHHHAMINHRNVLIDNILSDNQISEKYLSHKNVWFIVTYFEPHT